MNAGSCKQINYLVATGVNATALSQLPDDLIRLMCAALRRGMKMLGDLAKWGIVMEAPSECQPLPRRLPPPPVVAGAPMRAALLPHHLVNPLPSDDKTHEHVEATFRLLA